MLFKKWKPQLKTHFLSNEEYDHSYCLVSRYYICKRINGILHYKITWFGIVKIKEATLNMETHNFLVYLRGRGDRKISEKEFESGKVIG